ncbi:MULTISPECIES: urea ABC transporter permease subunit UrtB [unclassified Mesorhizobium]|uniref:urea ABC transporter permease subunit UrtB n=1 Tax=unclassified Mesorhizobium TaxID=325217 RepID=UPI000FD1EE83|nr:MULTISPECIES: urea ABC transporter permease subunit UrtB [unclassified Mesorhizobium]RUW98374.1 urea ABC transporter permease subunit UrtB [Mesorhizobium sp. M8A.F.Ca.ET.059.01.1.1]TGV61481.1 urea ABC transporter permease subunit UrtB [bacterium M00.F.Ca.ET.141.01.1.1]TIT51808.1 MAG: urea ABC transporter permease subunit UrtB [Mesorhizobium sp.]TGQ79142.1 urea ABC transporter permease subunit UrtB [Mesorhizobium sp. M8A.F.Ca.ET.207.01.1.1]TGT42563.1 urea ABC transporter permease subunit Urt
MKILHAIGLMLLFLLTTLSSSGAAEADLRAIIAKFATVTDFSETGAVVQELTATGDPAVERPLAALADGNLYVRTADSMVFVGKEGDENVQLFDPLSGEPAGEAPEDDITKISVNNTLRRTIRDALGTLTLGSKDPTVRIAAADTMFKTPDAANIGPLDAVIASESVASVKALLEQARAASILVSDKPDADKLAAIALIGARGDRDAVSLLTSVEANASGAVKDAATAAIANINSTLALWDAGQNIWYGISLGSVLLLAAIGLAITFGVMGVINMAHGEMVMLGAYTTFVVQQVIRTSFPGLFDWSLVIALPLAFLVAAFVGLIIERGVIRFLYGRPLETLLATWGVSLILQQAVRSIFGPTNQEVGNPSWMSGSFDVGQLAITWNRLWILVFALTVFGMLLYVMKRTPWGLQMRAVTANRRMAASMGIRTPWVDALTFALGSGIAGIAGVALSQIDNVSPNLGRGYIIDSFMVVVFGGVGNLWGTLVGAFSLGIVNKVLEPYAGAVLGKIVVLVLIILFIQKRPRGLFALKGRAVEA